MFDRLSELPLHNLGGGSPELKCDGIAVLTLLALRLDPARLVDGLRKLTIFNEGFGARGIGWARLSLAVSDEVLELGLERLRRALS